MRLNQACRDNLHLRDDEVVGKYNVLKDNLLEAQGFMPLIKAVFEKGVTVHFVTSYNTAAIRSLELEQTTRAVLDVNISPILDPRGKVTNAVIQHMDITKREQAEAALRASEDRFKTMFMQAPLGIALIDSLTGHIYEINSRFAAIAGRPLEEMANINWMQITHPDDVQADLDNMALLNAGKITGFQMEKRYLHPDGTAVWINMTIAPLRSEDTAHPHHLCMIEDITDRKRTREALQAHNEELDAFAHTVAHDLKNPLTLILSAVEALAQDMVDPASADGRRLIDLAVQGAYKADSIIESLLVLAGARQMEVQPIPLDMAAIVHEAYLRLADLQQRTQAQVVVMPGTWPSALGYAPWVEEVWVNYLSNALKYGGHPPRVELGYTILDLGSRIADLPSPQSAIRNPPSPFSWVRFWVRDHGPGLTAEKQARLFTPFTRLSQVNVKGYGLGLSIVQRIVEKLGGQVGVESAVGEGSLFWFTLPGVDSPPTQ